MRNDSVIIAALFVAFIIFTTLRGTFSRYISILTGKRPSAVMEYGDTMTDKDRGELNKPVPDIITNFPNTPPILNTPLSKTISGVIDTYYDIKSILE